jgi:hypothetical protein
MGRHFGWQPHHLEDLTPHMIRAALDDLNARPGTF